MRRHGIRLDKRLGQHFLADPRVPDRISGIVAALHPRRVVELACGAGALSFALLERGWPVHALELDDRMIELMREESRRAGYADRFTVEKADLAATDFTRFAEDGPVVFAGNLPYQVTSPVVFGLLPALARTEVAGAVLMVQAEVAQRMAAPVGGRTYGILSVLLQAELEVEKLVHVRPGSFLPPPEVDSAVVRLVRRVDPLPLGSTGRDLVRSLFGERRKQVGGLLRRRLGLEPSVLRDLLAGLDLDGTRRPESLRVEDFVRLRLALDAYVPAWHEALDATGEGR